MTRVLVILEGSRGATQDIVRGAMYAELFERSGVTVHYVQRRPAPPVQRLMASRSKGAR